MVLDKPTTVRCWKEFESGFSNSEHGAQWWLETKGEGTVGLAE